MNPRAETLLNRLQSELRPALEDAVIGKPLHADLQHQLKRTASAVLHRHSLRGAQIDVQRQGTGFSVTITVPPQGPFVQTVRLRLGQDSFF